MAPVIYVKNPPDITEYYQQYNNAPDTYVSIFQLIMATLKYKDWKYEAEWRYVGTKDENKLDIKKHNCKIKNVYLGCKISEPNEITINKIASENKFTVKKLEIKPNSFSLTQVSK